MSEELRIIWHLIVSPRRAFHALPQHRVMIIPLVLYFLINLFNGYRKWLSRGDESVSLAMAMTIVFFIMLLVPPIAAIVGQLVARLFGKRITQLAAMNIFLLATILRLPAVLILAFAMVVNVASIGINVFVLLMATLLVGLLTTLCAIVMYIYGLIAVPATGETAWAQGTAAAQPAQYTYLMPDTASSLPSTPPAKPDLVRVESLADGTTQVSVRMDAYSPPVTKVFEKSEEARAWAQECAARIGSEVVG